MGGIIVEDGVDPLSAGTELDGCDEATPLGNLQHRQALGGQPDDLRPLNGLYRTPSVLNDPLQIRAMFEPKGEARQSEPFQETRTVLRRCEFLRSRQCTSWPYKTDKTRGEQIARELCRSGADLILWV